MDELLKPSKTILEWEERVHGLMGVVFSFVRLQCSCSEWHLGLTNDLPSRAQLADALLADQKSHISHQFVLYFGVPSLDHLRMRSRAGGSFALHPTCYASEMKDEEALNEISLSLEHLKSVLKNDISVLLHRNVQSSWPSYRPLMTLLKHIQSCCSKRNYINIKSSKLIT